MGLVSLEARTFRFVEQTARSRKSKPESRPHILSKYKQTAFLPALGPSALSMGRLGWFFDGQQPMVREGTALFW